MDAGFEPEQALGSEVDILARAIQLLGSWWFDASGAVLEVSPSHASVHSSRERIPIRVRAIVLNLPLRVRNILIDSPQQECAPVELDPHLRDTMVASRISDTETPQWTESRLTTL